MKIGMKVHIINSLPDVPVDNYNSLVSNMYQYTGADTTIIDGPHNGNFYQLDVDNGHFYWHHTLLLPNNTDWISKGDMVEIIPFSSKTVLGYYLDELERHIGCKASVVNVEHSTATLDINNFVWPIRVLKKLNVNKPLHYPKFFMPKV